MISATLILTTALAGTSLALNANCAPGGNFDLSKWTLQLPTGSQGHVDTISSGQLQGCNGYQDPGHRYFFTESGDGALVMKVPRKSTSGCVTTSGSQHCRTELRESSPSAWDPRASRNRLSATLAVEGADSVCVGQIHIDDSVSSKPVAELYWESGKLVVGVERTRSGGDQVPTTVGSVAAGKPFSYEIRYEGNVLSVSIDGGPLQVLDTYDLDAPASYFKVGNYDQSDAAADLHFFAINVEH